MRVSVQQNDHFHGWRGSPFPEAFEATLRQTQLDQQIRGKLRNGVVAKGTPLGGQESVQQPICGSFLKSTPLQARSGS